MLGLGIQIISQQLLHAESDPHAHDITHIGMRVQLHEDANEALCSAPHPACNTLRSQAAAPCRHLAKHPPP